MLYILSESKGGCFDILSSSPRAMPYFSTFTPFQNATYPIICSAAAFGSG